MAEDQQERQTDLWSAYAAEGISSTSLSDTRSRDTRTQTTSAGPHRGSGGHGVSRNDSFSEREARSD